MGCLCQLLAICVPNNCTMGVWVIDEMGDADAGTGKKWLGHDVFHDWGLSLGTA